MVGFARNDVEFTDTLPCDTGGTQQRRKAREREQRDRAVTSEHDARIVDHRGRWFGLRLQSTLITGETGFGLIGMRERVELAGGRLDIESRVGHGTTIAVRIPV